MQSFNGKKQREKSVLKESNMATVNTKRSVAKKSKYRMNGYSRNASVIKVLRFLNIYSLKAFFPYRVGLDIQVNSLLSLQVLVKRRPYCVKCFLNCSCLVLNVISILSSTNPVHDKPKLQPLITLVHVCLLFKKTFLI